MHTKPTLKTKNKKEQSNAKTKLFPYFEKLGVYNVFLKQLLNSLVFIFDFQTTAFFLSQRIARAKHNITYI